MAFRSANIASLTRFNSATSSDFLDTYNDFVSKQIADKNAKPKSKTFAPSSCRCKRISWFRLRGVEPDRLSKVDQVLNFTAQIGTACHEIIQSNLKDCLQENWISVEDYLNKFPIPYQYKLTQSGFETQVKILDPYPIQFACDGIIYFKGKYYLLEIKTSEYASFQELTDPKSEHVDQIKTYCTFLNISDVLVLYQERQYGELKCYEMHVSDVEKQSVIEDCKYVIDCVSNNIAPDKLPAGDKWCTPGHCIYYQRCKEW